MKIIIAHTAEEQEEANTILSALRPLLAWEKIRKTDTHPPFLHLYFTTKNPGTSCNSNKNA